MANIKSAIKKIRVDERRKRINDTVRSKYRASVREVRKNIDAGDRKKAETALSAAYKQLDKAAKTNVIHKNKAARLKSRLASAVAASK